MLGEHSRGSPLDEFIPTWDARERHAVTVRAPASVVYGVVKQFELRSILPVRAIFALRERMMGATPATPKRQPFIDEAREMGWRCLVERTGELYVAGSACRPWLADVAFTPVEADRFRDFAEPGQVKIAWSIETRDRGDGRSELATETRVVATDAESRRRFLEYWRWARFGIHPIRWLLLPGIRRQAESIHRKGGAYGST